MTHIGRNITIRRRIIWVWIGRVIHQSRHVTDSSFGGRQKAEVIDRILTANLGDYGLYRQQGGRLEEQDVFPDALGKKQLPGRQP